MAGGRYRPHQQQQRHGNHLLQRHHPYGNDRGRDAASQPPEGYLCKRCQQPGHFLRDCPNAPGPQNRAQPCWFCLSNPKVASHLIVSVGDHVYLALPKGELCAGHVLLIPIDHVSGPLHELPEATRSEMKRFVTCLADYYTSLGQKMVWMETTVSAFHHVISVCPVTEECAAQLKPYIFQAAELVHAEFKEIPGDEMAPGTDGAFMRFVLPSNEQLIHYVDQARFDVQFGRTVLADLLGVPERADWKQCVESEDVETTKTEAFRDSFKSFDFTLQQDE